jgi:ubiquinone/menaquinone biosynthesis C-methylase UbiE
MTLPRVLEPEVMDTEAEARDYDAMDHAAVNGAFCTDLLACRPALDRVLDVGTGTARIPIELCRRAPAARVLGVDLADAMLALGAENVARAGLADAIQLERADAKALGYAGASFSSAISNTILHHLPEPGRALREMLRVLRPAGLLFVRDLLRPEDDGAVRALVDVHAAGQNERQRALLADSLRASLTLDEVRALVAELGVSAGAVTQTSDRHWTLVHRAAGAAS